MEKTEQKMPWKEFFSLVKSVIPSNALLIVAILLSALSSGAGLLIPLATQNMVDGLANNFLNKEIILLMGGLFFLNAIFSGISIYLLTFLGQRTTENLRFKLWKKMIFLPVSFFDEKRSGKLVSQITNDTTQVKNVITSHIITMISGGGVFYCRITYCLVSFRCKINIAYSIVWSDYVDIGSPIW